MATKTATETKFFELLATSSEEYCQKNENPSDLEPSHVYRERVKHEMMDFGKIYLEHLKQIFKLVIQKLNESDEKDAIQELIKGTEHFNRFISSKKGEKFLEDPAHNEKTIASIFHFSPSLLEKIYQIALNFYKEGELAEAKNVVSLLLFLDPGFSACWIMMGALLKAEQRWENSLEVLNVATTFDESNPIPFFHSARCLYELGRKKEAFSAIEHAAELAKRQPHYKELLSLIEREKNKLTT